MDGEVPEGIERRRRGLLVFPGDAAAATAAAAAAASSSSPACPTSVRCLFELASFPGTLLRLCGRLHPSSVLPYVRSLRSFLPEMAAAQTPLNVM